MFDIPDYAAGDVAESEMVNLSKSKSLEYPQEVFPFGFATFTRGEIGVQGVRLFREASSNVTRSRYAYR